MYVQNTVLHLNTYRTCWSLYECKTLHIPPLYSFVSSLACSRGMNPSELEYGPIEDWHEYEHAPACQVGKRSGWLPQRTLELHPRWARVGQEICLVIAEEEKV